MEDKMKTNTCFFNEQFVSTADLGSKLCGQIVDRYGIDPRLASEMAWDLLELIDAVDGDRDALDRFVN
jgi:hypothetical protein